ncbi:MAG: 3'-5' exonuclease [Zetaproteobacteria bacterium]|nr:3'-5' exonuclease [Zetaproteobacteria bacterium]
MIRDTLVFDIETVADAESARRLLGSPDLSDIQARDALAKYFLDKTDGKNDFPRQPFHQVVAISYVHLLHERDAHGSQWILKRIASGGVAESSEKELLEGFFHLIETRTPQLVSFNGRCFDMPVLKYRAMRHGLSCPRWFSAGDRWNNYESRYSSVYHLDLLEVLSDYGASARCSMDEVAAVFEIPGKLEVAGSDVRGLFESGDISAIRHYCEMDVCSTLLIFLRWQLFQGILNDVAYAQLLQSLRNYLDAEGEEKPHFMRFLEAWG